MNDPTISLLLATCPICDRAQHVTCEGGRWRIAPHRVGAMMASVFVESDCDVAELDALPLIRAWLAKRAAEAEWCVEVSRRDVGKAMVELGRAERNAAYVRATHPQLAALVPPETERPALSDGQRQALAAMARAEDAGTSHRPAPIAAPEDLAALKRLGLVERDLLGLMLGRDATTLTGRAWLAAEAGETTPAPPRDDRRHAARAVVAFGPHRSASFVFYEGRVLVETIEVEWSLDPREVLPSGSIARFLDGAVGVVLWEGEYRWSEPGCDETHGEWEVSGRCRPLTAEEWAAVGVGRAPWAAPER